MNALAAELAPEFAAAAAATVGGCADSAHSPAPRQRTARVHAANGEDSSPSSMQLGLGGGHPQLDSLSGCQPLTGATSASEGPQSAVTVPCEDRSPFCAKLGFLAALGVRASRAAELLRRAPELRAAPLGQLRASAAALVARAGVPAARLPGLTEAYPQACPGPSMERVG